MSPRRLLIALAGAAVPLALASAAAPTVVTQVARAFSLRELKIRPGDMIRFNNADEFIHHLYVNAPNFHFTSDEQAPGQTLDVRFPVPGQFDVRCEIHPKMLLRVSVE